MKDNIPTPEEIEKDFNDKLINEFKGCRIHENLSIEIKAFSKKYIDNLMNKYGIDFGNVDISVSIGNNKCSVSINKKD